MRVEEPSIKIDGGAAAEDDPLKSGVRSDRFDVWCEMEGGVIGRSTAGGGAKIDDAADSYVEKSPILLRVEEPAAS